MNSLARPFGLSALTLAVAALLTGCGGQQAAPPAPPAPVSDGGAGLAEGDRGVA